MIQMAEKKLKPCHCGCQNIVQRPFIDAGTPNIMVICTMCDSHMTIGRWEGRTNYIPASRAESARIDILIGQAHKATKETWNNRMAIAEGVNTVRESVVGVIESRDAGTQLSEKQWAKMMVTVGGLMVVLSKEVSKHMAPDDTEEVTFIPIPKSMLSKIGAGDGEGEDWN